MILKIPNTYPFVYNYFILPPPTLRGPSAVWADTTQMYLPFMVCTHTTKGEVQLR